MAKSPKAQPNTEPQAVDLDHLEENIKGVFFDTLSRGGIDPNDLTALTKIKHNQFDGVLRQVYNQLFKPSTTLKDNKYSLLPYDDVDVINHLIDIYFELCDLCDIDSTARGFCCMTGFNEFVLTRWKEDELNPARSQAIKRIAQNRIAGIESKLSDHPIGTTALANNSTSLGMLWARNNAQLQSQKAVYIIPADSTRGLPSVPAAGENLPQIVEDGTI